jgi:hypothetical protein
VPDRPQPDAQDLTIEAGPPAEVTFAAGRYTVRRYGPVPVR